MVDNFEIIKPLLNFPSDDIFYFVQIIQRKKDNKGNKVNGTNNNSRIIKSYYITSTIQLDFLKSEMLILANYFNARVGINLNQRSFERTAFHTLKKVTDQIMNREFQKVKKAYNTVCGQHGAGDKLWILDIDDSKEVSPVMSAYIQYECEPKMEVEFDNVGLPLSIKNNKIIAEIPTKSGIHLITKPFNLKTFKEKYPEVEVHKNNPTNLFIP